MRRTEKTLLLFRSLWLISLGLMVLALAVYAAPVGAQSASDGEIIFNQKGCAACHTVGGGPLVGPDLQGVTDRRDAQWIKNFITDPNKVIDSGDPIATALLAEYNNVRMADLGLSDQEVEDVLAYLATTSQAAQAPVDAPADAPAATPIPAPSTSAVLPALSTFGDPNYGRAIFTGRVRLENGGTSCIACHSVEGIGVFGGGGLGPDLTHVYGRFGREGLAGMLNTLPFPTMQGIFATRGLTVYEQADLLAFFEQADEQGDPRTQQNLFTVLGVGSGLAGVLLAGMLVFYPRQRMSISQRLRRNGRL